MSRQFLSFLCCTLLACFVIAIPAARATVIHSDVSAATVNFVDISEGSPTGDPEPLYGQPIAVVDTLLFPTTASFSAASVDGAGSDQTDGKLNFMVEAKNGYFITSLSISEGGLTTLTAPFGGDAYTEVVGFAVVKVLEIGNAPVNLPAIQSFLSITPLGGQYLLSDIGGSSFATGWTGSLNLPLPASTTKLSVTLDNNLFAATLGPGTRAFIDKKAFEIDVDTELIPEPTTTMLAFTGVAGMFLTVFRRKGAF